ncbi:SERPINB1 (predicted) [Pycnogonum litorale]
MSPFALGVHNVFRFTDSQFIFQANNPLLEMGSVDFNGAPNVSRTLLNKWVENKTERKIKELLKPGVIKSDTLLVILNAVYFKGTWKTKFNQNQTKTKYFTTSAGDKVPVEMMYSKTKYRNTYYDADSKVSAISLPYVDEKYSMILMLPQGKNKNVDDLVGRLTPQKIDTLLSNMVTGSTQLLVPKLKLEEYYDLSKLVGDLGAKSIFTNANMSGFLKTSPPIKVSQIVHQAFIDISEEGSIAAAATATISRSRSGHIVRSLIFNRPYVFMIREIQTGVILFMGVVKKP